MANPSQGRISRDTMHKTVITMLAFTLWLAASAHSAFGQAIPPSTTDPIIPSEPTHTVIPVHFDPATGDIKVGRTTYHGANPGLHLLAFNRSQGSTLDAPDLILDQVVSDANSAHSFVQAVLAKAPDALLLANGVGNYGTTPYCDLQAFGLGLDAAALVGFCQFNNPQPAVPLVFIGNGGRTQGALFRGIKSPNSVDGYLALDSNSKYAFIQTDYVHYDIKLDGSITIGATTYDVASSYKPICSGSASNSIHIVVVDRESLTLSNSTGIEVNNTYCTSQSPGVELTRIDQDLAHFLGDGYESVLVFIASNGHPIPPDWNFGTDGDGRVVPVARRMASLGGYFETMVYLTPSDTYSLVGAPPPPSNVPRARSRARESSSVYPDTPTGELHGTLARGRANWYSPINADLSPGGKANLGLYDILGMPSTPFPDYAPDYTPAPNQPTFYEYIANQLCGGCKLRDQYFNPNFNNFSDYHQSLLTITTDPYDVKKRDCADPANNNVPFCMERAQILKELNFMPNIRAFQMNLSGLITNMNVGGNYGLITTWQTVQATLPVQPPPTPTVPSLLAPLTNLFLGVLAVAPTDAAPVFGFLDTVFNFGISMVTDPKGNQTASLATPVANLATQLGQQFSGQLTTLSTQFAAIEQDSGKLNALGSDLASPPVNTPWFWPDTGSMLQPLQTAMEVPMYQSLMSAVYSIGSFLPNDTDWVPSWGQTPLYGQPSAYYVYSPNGPIPKGQDQFVQPFHTASIWYDPSFAYVPFTYPTDSTNPWLNDQRTATLLADSSWLAISLQSSSVDAPSGHYDPPETLLGMLFQPISKEGLGVYRPAFFEDWPFPRFTCTPSGGNGSPGGCNWNSGAPPLEAVLNPLTKVSIAVSGTTRTGTQVKLQLTIHNSGTQTISSVNLSNIMLRTLAGLGEANLVEPAMPLPLGQIDPGKFATIGLTLDVPLSVSKLQLTESGTAGSGETDPYRFSLGQVIFPNQ